MIVTRNPPNHVGKPSSMRSNAIARRTGPRNKTKQVDPSTRRIAVHRNAVLRGRCGANPGKSSVASFCILTLPKELSRRGRNPALTLSPKLEAILTCGRGVVETSQVALGDQIQLLSRERGVSTTSGLGPIFLAECTPMTLNFLQFYATDSGRLQMVLDRGLSQIGW